MDPAVTHLPHHEARAESRWPVPMVRIVKWFFRTNRDTTPTGPEDRAVATRNTAAGTPEGSTPTVSTEDQAAPPALTSDEAAINISTPISDPIPDSNTPTPDPTSTSPHHSTPSSPTGDPAVTQHHQLEEGTGHAIPIGAEDRAAATQDTVAGQPEDSTPAVSTEDQAAPPILPADEAASSISTPTSDPISDSTPNLTPTPTTQATEDDVNSNLHSSQDQAVHPTSAEAGSSTSNAEAPVRADALGEDPAPPSTHPSGSSAAVHTQEVVDEVAVDSSAAMQDQFMSGIQVLLRFAEGAINPAQGSLPNPITPGSADQGASNPPTAELVVHTVESFLIIVDVFQQDSKFTAAATLMDQVSHLLSQHSHTTFALCDDPIETTPHACAKWLQTRVSTVC